MKKKFFCWLSLFFVVTLCASLASCGGSDDDSGSSATNNLNGTWSCKDGSNYFIKSGDVLTMNNGTFSLVQIEKGRYRYEETGTYKVTGKYTVNTETHTLSMYCDKLYKMSKDTQDWELAKEFEEGTELFYDSMTYIIDDKTLSLTWIPKSYRATLVRQ